MTETQIPVLLDTNKLEEQIVDEAAASIARSFCHGEIPDLHTRVEELVRLTVEAKCDEVVMPIIEKGIAEFVFTKTNEFGEKKGEETTFTEYLVRTAEDYLQHRVDYNGQPKDPKSFGYKDYKTRLSHMIGKYLGFEIERAMKDAVKIVMEQVAPALAKTCEIQIKDVVANLTKKR